jgi:hypothetical protein
MWRRYECGIVEPRLRVALLGWEIFKVLPELKFEGEIIMNVRFILKWSKI